MDFKLTLVVLHKGIVINITAYVDSGDLRKDWTEAYKYRDECNKNLRSIGIVDTTHAIRWMLTEDLKCQKNSY